MEQELKDFCANCPNRKYCQKPCKPVERWLRDGQTLVFEDRCGDITIAYNCYNETRFSDLPIGEDESFIFADKADKEILSEAADEEIPIDPQLMQTKVFYERFFRQRPNIDLAEELGISDNQCRAIYDRARKRVVQVVELLDGRDYGLKHVTAGKKGFKFNDDERYFLLNKVFGFSVAEIARMPGSPKMDALKQRLQRMYRKYSKKFDDPIIEDTQLALDEDGTIGIPELMRVIDHYQEQGLGPVDSAKRLSEQYKKMTGISADYERLYNMYRKRKVKDMGLAA